MNRFTKISGILVILMLGIATNFKTDHGKYFEIAKNIEIFTNLYKEINTYYVDDLDPGKLMRTGVDAMLESLDPYTNYISESEIESFRYITEGKYNGIGALSRKIGDFITITELYQDQPADKAGLKVGDKLIAVDGTDAVSKSSEDVNNILRGFPGTAVELTIRRPGTPDDFKISLTRDEVKVPNVPYSGMISDEVGYIALTTFTRNAGKNVGDALQKLQDENPNMKGVVFDLRDNGGGLLTEAVNVSNVFVPKGELVVTTKGKVKDWDRSFKTLNKPVDEQLPLVTLINGGSASASEIVSGVIQDLDRGVLLGQRSYGKGLVQNTRDVGYNSRVKLTTAKYYIPSGRCIQGVSYENGEPINIPDEQRARFSTRNGRTVLDGGGVKPDMSIDKDGDSEVLRKLRNEFLLFDYATEYVLKHTAPEKATDFRFTKFDEFVQFLQKREFDYDTKTENLLDKLKIRADEDGYLLKDDLAALENKIIAAKKNDLIKHKEVIIDMIEKEIVGRYFYQRGKIEIGLRNDIEIKDAIALVGDSGKYNSLLQ
ncbi:MAG: S41 family peptidase [Saprospiraceae bacterium]